MSAGSRPLRRDAQHNRELLLAAAREVFGAKGLDAPLDEIARTAGVAIGTLYNRFPTRTALIEATFGEAIIRWVDLGEEAVAAEDPWEGLARYVVRTCEMQSADRGLTEVCTRSFPGAPAIEAAKALAWQALVRMVSRAQEAGVLRLDLQPGDLPLAVAAAARVAEVSPDPDAWRRHVTYLLDGFRARE
jgi:AcrR family transcriptional regulator